MTLELGKGLQLEHKTPENHASNCLKSQSKTAGAAINNKQQTTLTKGIETESVGSGLVYKCKCEG